MRYGSYSSAVVFPLGIALTRGVVNDFWRVAGRYFTYTSVVLGGGLLYFFGHRLNFFFK